MSFYIQRTTVTNGKPYTFYFMRMTGMGPMFQTVDIAKAFPTREAALECIDDEDLEQLDGVLEIVEK